MKLHIEIVDGLPEDEVVIRCAKVNEAVTRIHQYVLEQAADGLKLVFYKGDAQFYFPLEEILFFETEDEMVYAHTGADAYRIKYRLYELEDMLPRAFVRVAKSAIVNTGRVYAIKRDIAGSTQVQFAGTHKQVYASRRYYSKLKLRMQERSNV